MQHTSGLSATAIVCASGGASAVHGHSALALHDQCLVAVGDHVVALAVPDLGLRWALQVDPATCFGLYVTGDPPIFVSHGELEVARFDAHGVKLWSFSGADIFSEGFELRGSKAYATDFDKRVYEIDLETGIGRMRDVSR
jgi:hypothetical protein